MYAKVLIANTKFMDQELTTFLIDQFSKLATKEDLYNGLNGLRDEMRTELHSEIGSVRSEMVTKSEFYLEIGEVKREVLEVKEIVLRLDRRTD